VRARPARGPPRRSRSSGRRPCRRRTGPGRPALDAARQLDRRRRFVPALVGRPALFLEAELFIELRVRLADLLEQAVRARVVARRLPLAFEDEVTVEKLLPLLHLALEDLP